MKNMKTIKRILLIAVLASGVGANAQITFQSSYTVTSSNPSAAFQWVYLKHSGYKYLFQHSDTLDVYNLNYSLYKRIFIPSGYLAKVFSIIYVSEGLFDTDSLRIDYMIGTSDSIVVYQDNGSLVQKFDSVSWYVPNVGMGQINTSPIVTTDSGTFLLLVSNYFSPITTYRVYKLPGSLPCMPECSSQVVTTMVNSPSTLSGYSNVYPNPAISYTNIYYTLPAGTSEGEVILYDLAGREIKRFTVTTQFDHLSITTSDIRAGTYFYRLIAGGNNISSKKIVVVK